MVYTKHFAIRAMSHIEVSKNYIENQEKTILEKTDPHLNNLFPYVLNEAKTNNIQLVSGHHILNVYEADKEFLATKELFAKKKGTFLEFDENKNQLIFNKKKIEEEDGRGKKVLAHHIIQSFSPEDDLTPEQIHNIGRETILEFTGQEYEFVIATHIDKEHIHNHIIINSTNFLTGKQMNWKIIQQKNGQFKDLTKLEFEKISDKISAKYNAKIIEKNPKSNHQRYTLWQIENIYKRKIKNRLDFLLNHSNTISDFIEKARQINLECNFSGKHSKFKLLDEPQIKYTRGRTLDKKNPDKYNLNTIKETIKQNDLQFDSQTVVELYEEKIENYKMDFDYQIKIEKWQLSHTTEKGYYINIDGGVGERGQIFVGSNKVDPIENNNYLLYVKTNDYFYFTNQEDGRKNKYISGSNLMNQLRFYNGCIPLKKEPVIEKLHEIINAINFLAENDVQNGKQFENLKSKLIQTSEEAYTTLKQLDIKIGEMSNIAKLILLAQENRNGYSDEIKKQLIELNIDSNISYSEIIDRIEISKKSRDFLYSEFKKIQKDIQKYNKIEYVSTQIEKEKKIQK